MHMCYVISLPKKCEAAHNSNEYNLHVEIIATNSNEREAVFCSGCNIWAYKYKLELSLVLVTVHASPDSRSSQASLDKEGE